MWKCVFFVCAQVKGTSTHTRVLIFAYCNETTRRDKVVQGNHKHQPRVVEVSCKAIRMTLRCMPDRHFKYIYADEIHLGSVSLYSSMKRKSLLICL